MRNRKISVLVKFYMEHSFISSSGGKASAARWMYWLSHLSLPGEKIAHGVTDWLSNLEDELNGFYGGFERSVRRVKLGVGSLQQCVQQSDTLVG